MKIQPTTKQVTKTVSKITALLPLAVFIALFPLTGNTAGYPEPGNVQQGAKTWTENCARCHNIRSANELRDDQWISTVFHMRLRAGLTGQEARDVLTFLQGSNTYTPVSSETTSSAHIGSSTASGKTIYNQTCTACHGVDGKGVLPGVPAFTQAGGPLLKSDAVLIKHITEGFQSPGSPMAMPAKGGNPGLTDSGIRATLDYIRKQFGQ